MIWCRSRDSIFFCYDNVRDTLGKGRIPLVMDIKSSIISSIIPDSISRFLGRFRKTSN